MLAAGHCGFGLGATPTAIANMQAITERLARRTWRSWSCRWSVRSLSISSMRW
ncbi:sodium/glutamate symporter [Shigella sonnei]